MIKKKYYLQVNIYKCVEEQGEEEKMIKDIYLLL